MNALTKYFPWIVVAVFGLYAVGKMAPRPEMYKEFNLTAFGALPVLDGGRIKPLDSVARTNMLFISGQSEFNDALEDNVTGKTRPAILWLLETMAVGDPASGPAANYRVFRIDNEQLLIELELKERPGSYRYSYKEIFKSREKLNRLIEAAEKKDESKRELFDAKVIELSRRLKRYHLLALRQSPTVVPQEAGSKTWLTLAEVDTEAAMPFRAAAESRAATEVDRVLRESGKDPASLTESEAIRRVQIIRQLAGEYARQFGVAERKSVSPPAAAFGDILTAYQDDKPKAFADAISAYRAEYLTSLNPSFRDTTRFEVAFNAAAPFIMAAFIYVFAAVLMTLSWMGWSDPLRKAALGLAGIALALHVAALFGRMYLMGRPLVFVTNLYSSALMIGGAAVVGGLVMERLFKNGVGLVVGTTLGAITVKIAHHLTLDGSDTLGNLVAVLDTNFWLASHVTTVTLGYSATYVGGLLGIAYIWRLCATVIVQSYQTPNSMSLDQGTSFALALAGLVFIPLGSAAAALFALASLMTDLPPSSTETVVYVVGALGGLIWLTLLIVRLLPVLDSPPEDSEHERVRPQPLAALQSACLLPATSKKIGQMLYGVICFATLLSFVGTVLGGIWADQSWGRFWGWDPKENGAVLIVIWNALILHARWCGLVKQRGMAVLAVVGIMVTTWSWFGTNQLGVGLHNYGFNKTLAEGCMWTWLASMAIIAVGLIPSRYWGKVSPA